MPSLALDMGEGRGGRGRGALPFPFPQLPPLCTPFSVLSKQIHYSFPAFLLPGRSPNGFLPAAFSLQVFPRSSNDRRADGCQIRKPRARFCLGPTQ